MPDIGLSLYCLCKCFSVFKWSNLLFNFPESNFDSRNAGNSSSRASRRAELSTLLASRSDMGDMMGVGGMSSPLAVSSEDLSTRSASPRYNSTFNDDK